MSGAAVPAEAQGASVTLTLEQYQALLDARQPPPIPPVTVVESVELTGTLESRQLRLEVAGRALGRRLPVDLLRVHGNLAFSECTGDAVLVPRPGHISLRPLADEFELSCAVLVTRPGTTELTLIQPVLYLRTDIDDAQILHQQSAADGSTTLTIVPRFRSGAEEVHEPVGSARYLLTILPDSTRFTYHLNLDNPNRNSFDYVVRLANDETIGSVDATASFHEDADTLRFELVPGSNRVSIEGTLFGDGFAPPVPFEDQYLVIENHPMVRVAVDTEAPVISAKDTGISYTSRSAQGFIVSGGTPVEWTSRQMQVFTSQGYTITDLDYVVYLPGFGKPVVEAHLAVDNQGAHRMSLEIPGTPTFLEVDGVAQLLFRDEQSRLTIPLSAGVQSLTLQYQVADLARLLALPGMVELLRFDAPVSVAFAELRVHPKWALLAASFSRLLHTGVDVRSLLFGLGGCFVLWFLLSCLGFFRRAQWIPLVACFVLSQWSLLWLLPPLVYALAIAWLSLDPAVWWTSTARLATGVALVAAAFVLTTGIFVELRRPQGSPGQDLLTGYQMDPGPGRKDDRAEAARLEMEGLPAKVLIPAGETSVKFSDTMLPAGKPLRVRYALIPRLGLKALCALTITILGGWVWLRRRLLFDVVRQAWSAHIARSAQSPDHGG